MAGLPFLVQTRSDAPMRKPSRIDSSIGTVGFLILCSCVAQAQPAVSKRPAEFGVVVEKKVLIPDARRHSPGSRSLPPGKGRQGRGGPLSRLAHANTLRQERRRGRRQVLRRARLRRGRQRRARAVCQRGNMAWSCGRPGRRLRRRRVDRRAGLVRRQGRHLRHQLSRRYPARPGRDEPAPPDHDGARSTPFRIAASAACGTAARSSCGS